MLEESLLIEAKNITVSAKKEIILDNISLSVKKDDMITIVGINGAGKTTLLNALLGFIEPNMGEVIRKKDLKIGYVPQANNINSHMPLNVLSLLKLKESKIDKINQVLEDVGALDLKSSLISQLSGGEIQRVFLAMAILGEPDLLALDEPTSHLDVKGQQMFYELIERIHHERNTAVITISHDLDTVIPKSQRVICLYKHICCEGSPQDIEFQNKLAKIFGHRLSNVIPTYKQEVVAPEADNNLAHLCVNNSSADLTKDNEQI